MEHKFNEVDFECLIGKEWSLIGKRLRHEADGLWLKDPSAIDAAQWVDDNGKTHELWVHPTSTPTKPVLPFPFTLPEFKTFCGWHPTFEGEAITSVFTNDDDTVDTENLAFVDSRSRAAGALVRCIIGKNDDDFSQAWKQHCAVDDVEAKMVELAALKPDKISEIQYRDARLAELRDELAMLKQGISGTPSAQRPAAPAPVVAALVELDKVGPVPVTTRAMADSFAGLHWNAEEWIKKLGDKPVWVDNCIAVRRGRGEGMRQWNPVQIGAYLVRMEHVKANSVRARFQTQPALIPWLDEWKTYEADNHSTD